MEVLELDGINYQGRFEAQKLEGTETGRSCEAPDSEVTRTAYHYEGFGLVRSKEGFPHDGKFLFRFATWGTGNYRQGLECHLCSLVGGSANSLNLHEIKDRELLMFVLYQHLKKLNQKDTKTITPPMVTPRDISQMDFGNARSQLTRAFVYGH
jgi:hypothetical protein